MAVHRELERSKAALDAKEIVERYKAGERDFRGVDLHGANLTGAKPSEAVLSGADLGKAYLHEADLTEANVEGVHLREANLTGATMPDGTKHR